MVKVVVVLVVYGFLDLWFFLCVLIIIFWLVFRKLIEFGIVEWLFFWYVFCGESDLVVLLSRLKGVFLSVLIIIFGRRGFFGLSLGK